MTLDLLQSWLADERFATSKLVVVTRGAVAVRAGDVPDLVAAPIRGLLRSAQSEHPGRFVAIDLDTDDVPWPALLAADEPQLALREGSAFAPRLRRTTPTEETPEGLGGEGTVLVTGGTGGLGALVARHLAAHHHANRLLLVSRRGAAAPGAGELVDELAGLGCQATVASADVADRDDLARVLAAVPDEHPLTAVVHTAGILDDATIETLDPEQLGRVLRPKVDAAVHLHELTGGADLSAFVLFSSAAPLLGGAGQGNYAAANAFLDELARFRHAQGQPATSLAWGLWDQTAGMASGVDAATFARGARQIRDRLGLLPLTPDEGLALFDAALGCDAPVVAPAKLDAGALRAAARSATLPPTLRGLVKVPAGRRPGGAASLAARLAAVPEEARDAVLLDLVRAQVAAVLGHESGDAVDGDLEFKDLGFDSLAAVELRNGLTQATGLRLPATLVFDHPTPAAVAAHLREQVGAVGEAAGAAVATGGQPALADTLGGLMRHALRQGLDVDNLPLLVEASRLRPSFAGPADLARPVQVLRLAAGDARPALVCVPSFLPGSGPHQFARLAGQFAGRRERGGAAAARLPPRRRRPGVVGRRHRRADACRARSRGWRHALRAGRLLRGRGPGARAGSAPRGRGRPAERRRPARYLPAQRGGRAASAHLRPAGRDRRPRPRADADRRRQPHRHGRLQPRPAGVDAGPHRRTDRPDPGHPGTGRRLRGRPPRLVAGPRRRRRRGQRPLRAHRGRGRSRGRRRRALGARHDRQPDRRSADMTDQETASPVAPVPEPAVEQEPVATAAAPEPGRLKKLMGNKHQWGARPEDFDLVFPGDGYIPEPHSQPYYRAVDIDAPRPVVWRWLCQLAIAPYSYDWIDNWGRQSPRELTPGLENLEIGQRMVIIMELLEFEENEHLTFKICVGKKFWGHVGSTYRLVELPGDRCRLVNKVVVHRRDGFYRDIARSFFPWAELVMTRRQLLNMKELAEKTAKEG